MQLIWGEYKFIDHDPDETNNIVSNAARELIEKTIASATVEDQVSRPENNKVCIITQYYRTDCVDRRDELVYCINKNIEVSDSLILFTEEVSSTQCIEDGIKINSNVLVIQSSRLNYRAAFKWVKRYGYDDTVYLLTNTDCYFDDVEKLKSIDYDSELRFLTMSRWEYIDGSLVIARNPMVESWSETQYLDPPPLSMSDPPIEPWSSDSWAFKKNLTECIDIGKFTAFLGTALCEIITVHEMLQQGVYVHNIGFCRHITPIHVHAAPSRKPDDWVNGKKLNDFVPGILPSGTHTRTKDNSINNCWRIRGEANFLDADNIEHDYSEFVVRNLKDL
jgi:hypothetical protein